MKYKKTLQFVIILIVTVLPLSIVSAQDDSEGFDPVTLPFTEVRNITSEYADQDFILSIGLPSSYGSSDATYPVLYLLDPIVTFGTVMDVRTIGEFGSLPEMIIVGIGYPIAANYNELGTRNYLTESDNFLRFIDEELIPFVDENYPTEPSERAIAGWGWGAYFALYTLFHNSEVFNRYIAIDPPITDFAMPSGVDSIIQHEQDFAANPSPLFAKLFMSIATYHADHNPNIAILDQFSNTLNDRNYVGLEITTVFNDYAVSRNFFSASIFIGLTEVYCSSRIGCSDVNPVLRFEAVDDIDFRTGRTFITPDILMSLKSNPSRTATGAGTCRNMEAIVLNAVELPDSVIWIQLDCGDNVGWVQRSRLED